MALPEAKFQLVAANHIMEHKNEGRNNELRQVKNEFDELYVDADLEQSFEWDANSTSYNPYFVLGNEITFDSNNMVEEENKTWDPSKTKDWVDVMGIRKIFNFEVVVQFTISQHVILVACNHVVGFLFSVNEWSNYQWEFNNDDNTIIGKDSSINFRLTKPMHIESFLHFSCCTNIVIQILTKSDNELMNFQYFQSMWQ